MIKQCYCGKEFITYESKIKLGRGKYCSKVCSLIQTNKKLIETGEQTRFKKGDIPHNKKGFCFHKSRKHGKIYLLRYVPDHPNATKKGYVREHRLLIEKQIGRLLFRNEVVHHKDGNTLNNSLDNLELMTASEHSRFHTKDNVHKRWE